MANVALRIDNGLNTSGDPLRLAPGFLRRCEGAIYMPDDPDRPHKHLGRTSTGTLPTSVASGDSKGLAFLQYEDGDDKLILLADNILHEATAATSGLNNSSWSQIKDQAGTPAAFPTTGTFLKAIPDGDNGWIIWTGKAGERPLIREQGGHSWFLGLNIPLPVTLSTIATAPTLFVIDADTEITGDITFKGATVTSTAGFYAGPKAYDNDLETYALAVNVPHGATASTYKAHKFTFTDSGNIPGNTSLFIVYDFQVFAGFTEVSFQVSYDTGATFTTVYAAAGSSSLGTTNHEELNTQIVIPLTSAGAWTAFQIRIVIEDQGGLSKVRLREIDAHLESEGGAIVVDAGVYSYTYTEVFEVTGGTRPRFIESAPAEVTKITTDGTEFGIKVIFNTDDAVINEGIDGIKNDPDNDLKHYRRIYRSTKTGIYPDLALIGVAPITSTNWIDTFVTSGSTLGSVPLNIVYERDIPVVAAIQPPPFRDAVYFKGVIIAIPETNPFRLIWSMPGSPHYYPRSHAASLIPTNRNDELKGITAIGDSVIVFSRTMVNRVRVLPIVDRPNFSTQTMEIVPLSPNEGLAAGPLGHTIAYTQRGHSVAVWISDNGIWMTDGALVSEGGMGIIKLSIHMDWRKEVDVSLLSSAKITYDSILQILIFDYTDKSGILQTQYLHTSPHHWVPTGQDQAVPKITGPHTQFAVTQRVFGELSSEIRHWGLDSTANLLYNERTGINLNGTPIITHIESGLAYLQGSQKEFHAYEGAFLHSDWGPSESCELEIHTFRDTKGVAQVTHKDIALSGERETNFFLNRAGQAMRLIVRHEGNTVSDGSSKRAFGPVTMDISSLGEVES